MSSDADKPVARVALARQSLPRKAASAFFIAIALFSVLRMTWAVLEGSRLQYADYWRMIETLLQPDGTLSVPGLFTFSNHHFIAFAQLLYWMNIKLFAGSNIALGLIDVVIVCCTLGLLGLMIRRLALDLTLRFALFGLTGALLFSLSGAWNFIYGMSGAAWLSANLFVVAAIFLRSTNRNITAIVAALLATMSYGTGIFAWPAIIATGAVQRDFSQWWREWPYAVGFLVSIVVVTSLSNSAGGTSSNDYLIIARLAAAFLGSSVGLAGVWAEIAGWFALAAVPLLALWLTFFLRSPAHAGWVGLALYGWCAILVITKGRAVFMAEHGYQGRYYSIAALTWLGLSVMMILLGKTLATSGRTRGDTSRLFQSVFPWVWLVPLTVGALVSGIGQLEARKERAVSQALGEIALQLDVVDGSVGYLEGFTDNTKPFDSTRRLEAVGHYPFVEGWDLDCGLLGQTLETTTLHRRGGELTKVVPERGLESVKRIRAILPGENAVKGAIRCVVVIDPAGRVVGAGTSRRDVERGWVFIGIAHAINGKYRMLVFDEGSEPILLSDPSVNNRGKQ
jgi:hypothetical protein